ncbi:DeoR/GlpR family DNA-binding transcription regulator [Roseimarinus sediminis]|uniref:DeoR/GlpR family DNA-binding transcription regulator n=1 Tax=Roseimarinus sediminis TaxID=1610899 RepID=UPI003D1E8C06
MTISTTDRRLHITKQIEQNEQVDVALLSKQFEVSEVTIRKDLKYLEKNNILIRTRGGAIKQRVINTDLPILERRKKNVHYKKNIGKLAAGLIEDGETILLDSGTTIMELAKNISKGIEITIITNAIDIAYQLTEYTNIKVIVPGGFLRRNSISLVGEQAAETLRNYHFDKCFLSVDGIDAEKGLLTNNLEEAHLSRIAIHNSKEVILLADSSKFGNNAVLSIAPLRAIHTIITDENISAEHQGLFRKEKIKTLIAKS